MSASRGMMMVAKHDKERIKAAKKMQPIDHQLRNMPNIVQGETMRAGQVIRVVQSPLDRYQKRKLITPRQHTAGAKLADDYQLGILGARDPEKMGGSGAKVGISEAQILAAEAYRKAVQGIGQRLSSIVIAVCCEERTVEDVAQTREIDRKGLMAVFRIGLDHLGDHYGEPPEIVEETLRAGQITALVRGRPKFTDRMVGMVYRFEADGTVSGIQLGNELWTESAPSVGELRQMARKRLS